MKLRIRLVAVFAVVLAPGCGTEAATPPVGGELVPFASGTVPLSNLTDIAVVSETVRGRGSSVRSPTSPVVWPAV